MKDAFYGWDSAEVTSVGKGDEKVKNQCDLYDLLSSIWCEYSCAPRYRAEWSEQNKTLGQCSITAFLAQDVFGGKVYGVPLPEGGFHCYNAVGGSVFDLTSEQFGNVKLVYDEKNEQSREEHFLSDEKRARYDYLCREVKRSLAKR